MKKRILYIIIIILALIALGIFLFLKLKPPLGQPVYAPSGKLVGGFPTELILDKQAQVDKSYTINYQENIKQYTASFNSGQSAQTLFDQYKIYFENTQWQITNQTNLPNVFGLYAKKDNFEVNVTIVPINETAKVTLGYLVK